MRPAMAATAERWRCAGRDRAKEVKLTRALALGAHRGSIRSKDGDKDATERYRRRWELLRQLGGRLRERSRRATASGDAGRSQWAQEARTAELRLWLRGIEGWCFGGDEFDRRRWAMSTVSEKKKTWRARSRSGRVRRWGGASSCLRASWQAAVCPNASRRCLGSGGRRWASKLPDLHVSRTQLNPLLSPLSNSQTCIATRWSSLNKVVPGSSNSNFT